MTDTSYSQSPTSVADQPFREAGLRARQKALTLRSAEFRKGREESWKKLDELVTRIEKKGITALDSNEAQQLPLLYRAAMSSLSVARNIVLDRNLLLYLENLSLRAYLAVYGPRTGLWHSFSNFFRSGFPQAVRDLRWNMAIAFFALCLGIVGGYLLVSADMSYFHTFVPEDLAGGRGPNSTAEELKNEELFAPWTGFVDTFIVFANSLFRHNTIVGILCFGLSFALGIPTIILLIYNGFIIGAFCALHARHGLLLDFIGWLSIHGVTELLALVLCGAAGLTVAQKIIFPEKLPRLDSLAIYGQKAASVVAGSIALDFIASILEGGFRQLISNTPGRFGFAALSAAMWLYYFVYVGKVDSNGDTD